MNELRFSWDERKNRENLRKHNVSFAEAQSVFFDENAVEFFDAAHSGKEERFILLGMSAKERLLLVCHCLREEKNLIRIISARKATKNEQREYPW